MTRSRVQIENPVQPFVAEAIGWQTDYAVDIPLFEESDPVIG